MFLSYDRHFIDKIFGSGIFVDNEKYVTYIDIDAALQILLENNVAAHGFPVAVEGCAYQFAIGIDDGTARVAARNVVVTEETARQVAVFHGIFAKINSLSLAGTTNSQLSGSSFSRIPRCVV